MKSLKLPKIYLPLPKVPKVITKVLEDKYVLYFVFFLALMNLFGYMILGNVYAIIFFILVGGLTSFLTKNMILILSVPIVLTSIFMIGKKVKESFQNKENNEESPQKVKEPDNKSSPPDEISYDESSPQNTDKNEDTEMNTDSMIELDSSKIGKNEDIKINESMTTYNKKNKRIDYASTVEDAYSDLSNILGGDGIKNLTSDTQKLMNQQLQLADAMKSMTPLLESAKGLLQGFDMKNLNSLSSLAKNFNMSGGAPGSIPSPM